MHIGLWSPAWPPEKNHNGIVTYVHWMKQGLEELGHRVTVLARHVDAGPHVQHVHRVQPGRWRRLHHRIARHGVERRAFDLARTIAPAIMRIHRRDPFDIFEIEESFGWSRWIQRRTGLPIVVKLHGPAFLSLVGEEVTSPFGREKIMREGDALRQARAIVSPTRQTLEQTVRRYHLTTPTMRCIVNPLALPESFPLWRLETCDRNTILFVGRFDERKGGDVILHALAALLPLRPGLRLIFVGPDWGVRNSAGRTVLFSDYCNALLGPEHSASVDYRGPLPGEEIAKLRAQACLTVIASRWENPGYTLLEAMLQACPVVSSDAGGCPESVTHGVTGRLATSGDPAAFAKEIGAMLDDPIATERMGKAARRHVQERHAPMQVAAEAVELYRQMLSQISPRVSRRRCRPAPTSD